MAPSWIKMRIRLREDPDVGRLALWFRKEGHTAETDMGRVRRLVVGYMLDVWGWAHEENRGGLLQGATLEDLDLIVDVPGLGAELARLGWFEESPEGVRVTAHERWVGSKQDAAESAAERKRRSREKKRDRDSSVPDGEVTPPSQGSHGGVTRDSRSDVTRDPSTSTSTSTYPSEGGERRAQPVGIGSRLAEVLNTELEPITDEVLQLAVRLDRQTREAREGKPLGKSQLGVGAWRTALRDARRRPDEFRARVELTVKRSAENLQDLDDPKGSAKPNLGARANLQRENQEAARELLEREARGEPLPSIWELGALASPPEGPAARVLDVGGSTRPRGGGGGSGQHRAAQAEVAL